MSDPSSNATDDPKILADRQLLQEAKSKGGGAQLFAFFRLSGPGWLQSAITLGSNSLVSSLYLGVLVGFGLMWLQPLAMILGVVMLSAISYVTLSTNKSPFRAINEHVNPVLGWGWVIATLAANIVWCLPQFNLGVAGVQQNLLPALDTPRGDWIVSFALLTISLAVVWAYGSKGKGVKIFEIILKLMIGVIVLCFVGVVKMSLNGLIRWGDIGSGFIPDLNMLSHPADTLTPFINESPYPQYWSQVVVADQRNVLITAVATAVGINMTFLLPYSMMRKGWDKTFRGLAIFDLSTGLFIPYILATGCVVIASTTQFHATPAPGFLGEKNANGELIQPADNLVGSYKKLLTGRLAAEHGDFAALSKDEKAQRFDALADGLPRADKKLAAMLVHRDPKNFAESLTPLIGSTTAHTVFGIGVTAMAVSTIIILMLISGLVICEMFRIEPTGMKFRLCCLPSALGVFAPILWTGNAKTWLSMPTSVICMALLPIAYISFFLLFNQRKLMGEHRPRGLKLATWNTLMLLAIVLTGIGSAWSIWSKGQWVGVGAAIAFIVLALIVHVARKKRSVFRG